MVQIQRGSDVLNSNKESTYGYTKTAIAAISDEWTSFDTGLSYHLTASGGPNFGAIVWKHNNSYGAVLLFSYHNNEPLPVYVRYYQGAFLQPVALR